MKTTTALIFVAGIFLSLGIGTAMAQGPNPSGGGEGAYFQHQTVSRVLDPGAERVQSGSPDARAVRCGAHAVAFRGNYGTLANPG
jgi:hypothetical protein